MLMPKLYSLAEANQLIPFLEDSFAEIRDQIARARAARLQFLARVTRHDNGEAVIEGDPELAAVVNEADERIRDEMSLLQRMGVLVKSIDPPTADVFSRRGASLVHLCWQPGEPEFLHWHSIESGIAGREPIDNPELFGDPVLPS